MELREIRNTGVKIPPVGVGCWQFGDAEWGDMTQPEVDKIVQTAVNNGLTFFDNAEVYAGGRSEEMFGKAISNISEQLVVLTKCRGRNLIPENVPGALDASLKRMGRDHIDIYLIHFPVDDVPVADTLEAMDKLRKAGKVRAIGISNYTEDRLVEALSTGLVDVVENNYSILWRYMDRQIRDECQRLNIAILSYSSLAQGILTGNFTRKQKFSPEHTRGKNKLYKGDVYQKALDVVDLLRSLEGKYNKTTSEIALNWTIYRPGITSALVGMEEVKHVNSVVNAIGWSLDVKDSLAISKAGLEVDSMLDSSLPVWDTQPVIEHAG